MITRVKTFDSTGLATSGRLYAGDLNAIQDALAAQSDFTQTIDVSTLRIGYAGLQIVAYSSTRLRVSGELTADGIIISGGSNVGGLLPGTYTTTQRDAIASGFHPYGLAIVNTTTNQWEWNSGTTGTPVWKPIGFDATQSLALTGSASHFALSAQAASNIAYYSIRSGDSYNRFQIREDGQIKWGPGNLTQDTDLFRASAALLQTTGGLLAGTKLTANASTSNQVDIGIAIGGAASPQIVFNSDTNFYRTAIGALKTDGTFDATGLKISGTALASTHLSDTALLARLASPALSGTPTTSTPAADDNSTRIINSAWYFGQVATTNPVIDGTAAVGSSNKWARADHVHPTDTSRAPLASPTFTGIPAAPTAAVDTSTTQLATTAFVVGQGYAKLASPALTGTPTAPTAAVNTNTTQLATTAYVVGQGYAKLASPALTGVPTAPTAAAGTNTTQLATTAFVIAQSYKRCVTASTISAGVTALGTPVSGDQIVISTGNEKWLMTYDGTHWYGDIIWTGSKRYGVNGSTYTGIFAQGGDQNFLPIFRWVELYNAGLGVQAKASGVAIDTSNNQNHAETHFWKYLWNTGDVAGKVEVDSINHGANNNLAALVFVHDWVDLGLTSANYFAFDVGIGNGDVNNHSTTYDITASLRLWAS